MVRAFENILQRGCLVFLAMVSRFVNFGDMDECYTPWLVQASSVSFRLDKILMHSQKTEFISNVCTLFICIRVENIGTSKKSAAINP